MSFFDVRIPGLKMTVVATDGQDIEPVTVDEFRIGTAEVYDVIVQPADAAYTVFAQSMDRSGFARGTLAPRAGMAAEVPALDAPALLTMADMGMNHAGMDHSKMDHSAMPAANHARTESGPIVDMRVDMPNTSLGDPGVGLRDNGRRVLTYADLATLGGPIDSRARGARDRAAPHGPHGALHLVVQRPEILRRQTAASSRTANGCASCS